MLIPEQSAINGAEMISPQIMNQLELSAVPVPTARTATGHTFREQENVSDYGGRGASTSTLLVGRFGAGVSFS